MSSSIPIRIFRCSACGQLSVIPREYCGHCHEGTYQEFFASAEATIVSWTVIRRPPAGRPEQGPYVVIVAELGLGLRLAARLIDDCDNSHQITVGQRIDYQGCGDGLHLFALPRV